MGVMLKHSAALLMITAILFFTNNKVTAHCNYGEVRLVNGSLPNEGRVEVCVLFNRQNNDWGTICDDHYWGIRDANVVCKQLNYRSYGAQPVHGTVFGQGTRPFILSEVHCTSIDAKLLDCHRTIGKYCSWNRAAGVRCRNDQLRVSNVNATIIGRSSSAMHYTIMVSWKLKNITMSQPNSFNVECLNNRLKHSIELSVNNETFLVKLGGLFPFATYYNCCVKAVYGSYVADEVCTLLRLPNSTASGESDVLAGSDSDNRTSVVGGVLGFIIALLIILLVICGGALLLLLRSQSSLNKRSTGANNMYASVEMPVTRNLSYNGAPCQPRTSGPPTTLAVDQSVIGCAAAEYSIIGPSYDTTANSREQQDRGLTRLSERYEISGAHLAMHASASGGSGAQGEPAANYEVPLDASQGREDEEYSRLQH